MSVVPKESAVRRWGVDPRSVTIVLLVTGLIGIGVLYTRIRGPSFSLSFSSQVSFVYWPVASLLMLTIGWNRRYYPLVAGLFYGFLPLAQAAGNNYFLSGEGEVVLTFEMALALPLIVCAFFGPSGRAPNNRPVPTSLSLGWALVLMSAIISTVLAVSPYVAFGTLMARFIAPILVTIGTFRRLRNIEDYKVVWLGFVVGILILTAFNVRRITLGPLPWYADDYNQRSLGASLSFSFPALFIIGPALWYGHALSIHRSSLYGVLWMAAAAILGLLFWLGGHRGPVAACGLIVLWWLPRHVLRYMFHSRGMMVMILGVLTVWISISYFLGRTTVDVFLIADRFMELATGGLRGTSRYPLWMEALGYWQTQPIFGIGLNNWVVKNTVFESCHSAFFGILIDTGTIGALAFITLFGGTLWFGRRAQLRHLNDINWAFVAGCRASWVVALLVMFLAAPFTSGQMKNTVFSYMVFFYPLLIMVAYSRESAVRATMPATVWSWQHGDAVIGPAVPLETRR